MKYILHNPIFASVYGCGNYQTSEYSTGVCGTSTATPPAPNDLITNLSYTGYDIIVPLAIGVSIVGASLVLLIKQLLRKNQTDNTEA